MKEEEEEDAEEDDDNYRRRLTTACTRAPVGEEGLGGGGELVRLEEEDAEGRHRANLRREVADGVAVEQEALDVGRSDGGGERLDLVGGEHEARRRT